MKEINALELRKKFGEIIDEVRYRKEPMVVRKNGRPVIVLIDADVYRSSQENMKEEIFIEEYTAERIEEFLKDDKIDKSLFQSVLRKTA